MPIPVSFTLLLVLFYLSSSMALRAFGRVSCRVLGHGACECAPAFSTVQFCGPARNFPKPSQQQRALSMLNNNDQFLAKLSTVRLHSSRSSNEKEQKTVVPEESGNFKDKLKSLWKSYGIITVGTYLGVYVVTLGSVFVALDFDIFNAATFGLDPAFAIEKFCDLFETVTGNTFLPGYIRDHPKVGTFAIAWVMTKFTEPLRLGFTVATVPTIARFFGRRKEAAVAAEAATTKVEKTAK